MPGPLDPDGANTWWITRTSGPGSGRNPYVVGEVERAIIHQRGDSPAVPPTVPGYQRVNERLVSVLVVVLAAEETYVKDGQDQGLGANQVWRYDALVRLATESEAADQLAAEAQTRRHRELTERVDQLFNVRADDARRTSLRRVPDTAIRIPVDTRSPHDSTTRYWADRNSRKAWVTTDDWWEFPLTAERQNLVDVLVAEYASPQSLAARCPASAEAIGALLAAGWQWTSVLDIAKVVRLDTADDIDVLVMRGAAWWRQRRWLSSLADGSDHRPAPADAARLAEAGISFGNARRMYRAGLMTVESQLAARSTSVPDDATRIVLTAPATSSAVTDSVVVTDSVEQARQEIADCPAYAADMRVHTAPVRVVHVGRRWQLWSDQQLTVGLWQGHTQPRELHPAAAEGVTLVVDEPGTTAQQRENLWQSVLTARSHDIVEITADEHKAEHEHGTLSITWRVLREHRFTTIHESILTFYQVERGWQSFDEDDDETDFGITYALHTDREAACAAYHALENTRP